jgi:hypothetical protein
MTLAVGVISQNILTNDTTRCGGSWQVGLASVGDPPKLAVWPPIAPLAKAVTTLDREGRALTHPLRSSISQGSDNVRWARYKTHIYLSIHLSICLSIHL